MRLRKEGEQSLLVVAMKAFLNFIFPGGNPIDLFAPFRISPVLVSSKVAIPLHMER